MRKLIVFLLYCVYLISVSTGGFSQGAEMISMDFDNVELRTIIKFMSELTGKNFIIDSTVKGFATVISPTKISVEEAYKVLESILVVNGYTTVPADNMVKVIPLDKAKQLDIETQRGKEVVDEGLKDRMVTQIVPLEYADVEKLKNILSPYVSASGHIASYPPTNTLIITETSSNLSRLLEILRDLDESRASHPDNVHVFEVENTSADELAKLLNRVYLEQKQKSKDDDLARPATIVADISSNSLIILASPQEYIFLEALIKKLDKRKQQVFVEAVIAEVSLGKTAELGLELAAAGGIIYGSSRGFSGVSTKGVVNNILSGGGLPATTAGAIEGVNVKRGVAMPNLGLLITASKDSDDINIISAPQILATDNEEAKILVGKKLAFIKNSQVTPEGSTVRTFEYRDVGLMLKIIPHITNDGFVRMDIVQEVENVIGMSFEGAVETSHRQAKTIATVKDDNTIVIGGLLTDKSTESVEKVPFLGDIPVVSVLFKRTKSESEKMNLFLFITPHILKNDEEIQTVTQSRKDSLEELKE